LAKKKDRETIYRLINQYIDALKQRNIHVAGSFLFGSYVKGNPSEWSDIDVAILTDKFIGDSFDFRFLLMKIARDIDADIEPHPFLVDEFNEDNPAAAEILSTGEKINV
jgi:predicted nucleotidyltransferase